MRGKEMKFKKGKRRSGNRLDARPASVLFALVATYLTLTLTSSGSLLCCSEEKKNAVLCYSSYRIRGQTSPVNLVASPHFAIANEDSRTQCRVWVWRSSRFRVPLNEQSLAV
jgi:hypothetical protein